MYAGKHDCDTLVKLDLKIAREVRCKLHGMFTGMHSGILLGSSLDRKSLIFSGTGLHLFDLLVLYTPPLVPIV